MKDATALLEVMRMGQVTRFHTRPLIRPQTTSEHSGRVALLLLLQWPDASMRAVKAALTHDLAEHYTGDMPAPVKLAYPGLGAALSAIEAQVEAKFGIGCGMLTPEELWWLKWCDYLEGVCKCLEELAMGNTLAGPPVQKWLDLLCEWADRYAGQVDADDAHKHDMLQHFNTTIADLRRVAQRPHLLAELYQ